MAGHVHRARPPRHRDVGRTSLVPRRRGRPEVDLSATAKAVASETETASTAEAEAAASGSSGIEGTWVVDTTMGTFTVTEATSTFAGFRVEEVLTSIGSTTAVGRTPDVSGTVEIEGARLTAAELVADLTGIVSDQSRREDSIQRALGTTTYPDGVFVLTDEIELGDAAAAGELVRVLAVGELTINGVTNQVEIALEDQLVEGGILITGSTEIVFADYNVAIPTAPAVLSVEDNGIVEFQIWLSASN